MGRVMLLPGQRGLRSHSACHARGRLAADRDQPVLSTTATVWLRHSPVLERYANHDRSTSLVTFQFSACSPNMARPRLLVSRTSAERGIYRGLRFTARSAVSFQLSAVSNQLSAVSSQLSAVSSQLTCKGATNRVNIIALVVPRGRASVTLARPRRLRDYKPFSWASDS
jgi:hypothetical protein